MFLDVQGGDSEAATLYQEAFDKLLECWLAWLTARTKVHELILPQSVAIFEAYLSWRLSGSSPSFQDDEEVDELDEDDRVSIFNFFVLFVIRPRWT